jgi:molybdopterin-guanine dinucleotide biosynthesis protein A
MSSLSAVVLAGGTASRMGTVKALLPWDGRPLIARVAELLSGLADEVLIVTNDPEPYRFLNLPLVPDRTPGLGPLAGIEAGLSAARSPVVFVCACDMPFLSPDLIEYMAFLAADGTSQAVVPVAGDHSEPLCAVYRREALPIARRLLADRRLMLQEFLLLLRLRTVPEQEWSRYGPAERLFFNCNTPADVARARRMK